MTRFTRADWIAQTGGSLAHTGGMVRRPMRNPLTGKFYLVNEPVPSPQEQERVSALARAKHAARARANTAPQPRGKPPPARTTAGELLTRLDRLDRKFPTLDLQEAMAAGWSNERILRAVDRGEIVAYPRTVEEAARTYSSDGFREMMRRGLLPL